ncbi:unnamed protein product [Cuscuta campestris]|uniref:F-box domain-containing protein n=1 Tax=Cuscuta campestris TaxID=132261 RepID=A0A484MI70_9ASTE|nr:unnamed protein product [Cuscuta campestris]VFQ87798.1 unnamed protein product [Cuscuta campestris]
MDSESSHQSRRRRSRSLIWDLVRCDRLDNLCESLLIDILSRLPCRAAAQFKSVCKRWNSLISSDYFVRLFNHRRHDPESSAYTLVFVFHRPIPYYRFEDDCGPVARCSSGGAVLRVDKLDLSFLPPRPPSKIAVNASCDDLILCSSDEEPKPFYVCNLRTRQWVDLPPVDIPYPFANDYLVGFLCNPPPCSLCLGVKGGVDINKLEFMVVLIRHQIYRRRRSLINSGNGVSHIQVLLFSSEEGQWKSLTVSSPSRNLYGLEAVEGNVVPYKGKLHWLNYNDILVYDPYNDPTKLSRVIEMDFDHFDRVSLGVFQNRLRVASTTVNENPICHCVWELEDYEMEKWRLVHELENTSRNSPIIFMFHDGNALCWENEGSRVWLFNFQSVGVGQDHKYELVPPGLDHLLCEVYVHQIADHWWPTPLSSLSCHQGVVHS